MPIWLKSGKILSVVHEPQDIYNDTSNIKLFHNYKVDQSSVSMATIRIPQQQIEKIFLHSHDKHSYAKVPDIYIILGTVNY